MDATPPEERLLNAFGRFALNINNLQVFYGTTTDLLETGSERVQQKVLRESKEHIAKPEVREFFGATDCEALEKNEPFFNFFMTAFANRSVRLSKRMVGASTLVFAHTILDELLTECCYIAFGADPRGWYSFIEDRKVELRNLINTDVPTALHQKALEFVKEKAGQSMIKRFNFLNQICVPKLSGEKPTTALIDSRLLDAFDQLRHRIIHGQPFSEQVSDVEGQVLFVAATGTAVLCLVGKAYKLFEKGGFTKDTVMSKWASGLQEDLPEVQQFQKILELVTAVRRR